MSFPFSCCKKATPEPQQLPPRPTTANQNRLVGVLPKIKEGSDIYYEWIGAEPKIKNVVANLAEIDLDHRAIDETTIVLAKLKIERLFARAQMLQPSADALPFVYCKAPDSFNPTIKNGACADGKYKWSVTSHKRNPEIIEDKFVAEEFTLEAQDKPPFRVQLFAIYVGHDGNEAVDYVTENLALEIQLELTELLENHEEIAPKEVFNAIVKAFVMTDQGFKQNNSSDLSGCEVSGVLLFDGKLWPFNLGAAKTDLIAGLQSEQLTEMATMENERYHRSILRRSTELAGDWTSPRSIGDKHLKACSARPKIYQPITLDNLPKNSRIMISSKPIAALCNCAKLATQLSDESNVSSLAKNMVYSAIKLGVTEACTSLVIELN